MPRARRDTVPPRLLNKADAAAYCGVSVPTFAANCPVSPVKIGETERFDRFRLDQWLDQLSGTAPLSADDWLDRVEKDNARAN